MMVTIGVTKSLTAIPLKHLLILIPYRQVSIDWCDWTPVSPLFRDVLNPVVYTELAMKNLVIQLLSEATALERKEI